MTDPYWGNQLTSPGATAPYANIVGQSGVVKITQTESASNYNALQAVFRQHLTAGLELTANYTLSKSLTDDIGFYGTSNINNAQYYQQNAYDMKSEWAPAGFDTRHNISVTGEYDLPFGRGRRFGGDWNYVENTLLGGWKLSGADVYYSGFPNTAGSPVNYSNKVFAFTGAARPDQISKLHMVHRSINAFYGTNLQNNGGAQEACASDQIINPLGNTCVFAAQSANHFGDVRPSTLPGPSFQNIDMAVFKTFDIWRQQQLNFRVDAFNLFNIASYQPPDPGVTDVNFGQITNTVSNPRSLQLALKYIF